MKYFLIPILAIALTGCASTDYKLYAEATSDIEVAKHNAEAEKYKAIAAIGSSGTEAAKVAAIMSLTMGGNQNQQQGINLRAPETAGDTALRWASIVVPTLMQGYGIHATTQLGMRASDNGVLVSQSTNNAFVGMAGKIQAPVTVLPQANVTTTTTTTSTDSHNISNSYNPTTTTPTTTITGSYNPPTTTTDSHNTVPPTP